MGIHQNSPLIDVAEVRKLHALTGDALVTKQANDEALAKIIKGEDKRILLVIGPCSSDNEEAVLDYAHRLAKLQEEVKDKIFIVMRVYTAKPRTNGDGYKGLIHQPDAEGDVDLLAGVKAVRHLQSRIITETGLPIADEMLYPSNLSFFDDLLSYHAVGARSVEDQEHRFVASGIDVPIGLKNPTSGNLNVMFNGIYAAQNQQHFLYNGAEVKTDGTHSLTLSCVVPTMKMVRTLSTTITRTWLRLWTSIVHLIWKIHLSLSIQTMITLVKTSWNKFVLCVKSFLTVSGMSVSRIPCVAL